MQQDVGSELVNDMYELCKKLFKISNLTTKMVLLRAIEKIRESDNKIKHGYTKKDNLVKQNVPLKIFEIQRKDLHRFERESQKYGFQFTIIEDKKLGTLSAMYREQDTPVVEKALSDMNTKERIELDKRLEQIRAKDKTIGNVGLDELIKKDVDLSSVSIKTKWINEFEKLARSENMAYSTMQYNKEDLTQIVKELKQNPKMIDIKMKETIINFKNSDFNKIEKTLEKMIDGGKKSLNKRLKEIKLVKKEINKEKGNIIDVKSKEER
jgi:hypothetical protein